ncbi:hypothetical protein, partial [Actinomadura monticuli]
QPATGPPGSYPDRTHTGKRRRAYEQDQPLTRHHLPFCWAHEKGSLMLCLGMLIVRLGTADEVLLHGRGRRGHLLLALLLTICAAGLAAPPGFGPFLSLTLIYDALTTAGYAWTAPLLAIRAAISAGAVLRATARIFLGWGPPRDPTLTSQETELHPARGHHRLWPLTAPLLLALAAYSVSFIPDLPGHAIKAAADLHDHTAHARLITQGITPPPTPLPEHIIPGRDWGYGLISFLGAILTAAIGLWWQHLPGRVRSPLRPFIRPPIIALKAIHSGRIGDYTTWLIVATAALALSWTVTLS